MWVLMDVRLQGSMDGAEAARQIRWASEVPIVFLTANVSALNLGGLLGRNNALAIDQRWMRLRDNRPATHTVVTRKQLPSSHLPYVFESTTKRLSWDLSAVRKS